MSKCNDCGIWHRDKSDARRIHDIKKECPDKCGLSVPEMSAYPSVGAEYVGLQSTETKFNFRLYNVIGDHPLRGSTVNVEMLVNEEIPINDLTEDQITEELISIRRYKSL